MKWLFLFYVFRVFRVFRVFHVFHVFPVSKSPPLRVSLTKPLQPPPPSKSSPPIPAEPYQDPLR